MDKKNQQILVCSAVIAVISIIVIGMIVVQKLERVVQVAERSEQKLNNIIETASPVGRAAIEKGVNVLNNVDEDELAKSAEEGVKEVGSLAKDKLLEWINSQKASSTNIDIPNLNITIESEATMNL